MTKAELEDRVDDLEELLNSLDNELLDLAIDLRAEHDRAHDEPWSVCRNQVCRRAIAVENLRKCWQVLS